MAQVNEVPSPSPAPNTETLPADGLFFADVIVRGQPIFQVGSLSNLSASDRAQIINRRIASFLAQRRTDQTVTVQADPERGIATLQLNNRILMTVTQQDSQDFNTPVEDLAQQWARELNRAFDEPPLAIDVGQRLYSTIRQFQRDTIDQLPAILGAILIVIATLLLASSVRRITLAASQRWEIDYNSKALVSRVMYGSIWVLGAIVALSVLGMDFATLVGTLGLTSVAIGFSLRDILSNYFSGIILLASRPFRVGDQILIQEFEGTVQQIQLRATTLVTYDGRVISIPNQEVFTASIINNTASKFRRSSLMIGIAYDADITRAKEVIHEAVLHVDSIVSEPPPEILVRELAASTVRIEIRFWVNSRRLPFLESTSQVAQSIKERLAQSGIELPTEIYTIKLKNDAGLLNNHHINRH
ncbi:mechanosensitive ion channel family protein [Leptolyngbya sp. AN03gr2]|uniref:mechanosensitive ion channel family protein n=1 Tax=unclassified Leptolyngbya TaxID=2650499 RepID=UPI003D32403C